jgi:hypothetical protein
LKTTSPSVTAKQLEKVQYFNNFDSLITSDARCTRDSKSRIAMARAAFINMETVSLKKLALKVRIQ